MESSTRTTKQNLIVNNLSFSYEQSSHEENLILKDITFEVAPGNILVVQGESGVGKSTLLKIIAGIDKDFKGEVFSDNEFSVGLLEQEPQLDDSKTVMEIVREGVQDIVDVLDEFNAINDKFADPYYG